MKVVTLSHGSDFAVKVVVLTHGSDCAVNVVMLTHGSDCAVKVATLLRLATMQDHLFVLSHVLRCPAGIAQWAVSYVQPLQPPINTSTRCHSWASVLLDHLVTMLAMILQPVRSVSRRQ